MSRYLKNGTFYGNEIVSATFKTALTNPPFGKKSSITFTNEAGEQEEE